MTDPDRSFSEDELLQFIHGHAPDDLAARIEQAQGRDRELAAEIALMQGLKPALAASAERSNPPGELEWRRLEADIRRESRPASAPPQRSGGIVMWKAAAVFFALLALGQAGYQALGPGTGDPGYRTATGASATHVLAISFQDGTSEADLRALLQQIDATLVDGPGASGLYRIAFTTPEAMASGRDILNAAPIIEVVLDE